MSELISGKEAKLAWANGKQLQWRDDEFTKWIDLSDRCRLEIFDNAEFRIKPRTISINGIEVPAPFEPKEGDKPFILSATSRNGYAQIMGYCHAVHFEYVKFGAWRTEEEIKQVVAALRSVFK